MLNNNKSHGVIFVVSTLILLLIVSSLVTFANNSNNSNNHSPLTGVDLTIFYGQPDASILADMQNNDVLILESYFYSESDILTLNNHETETFGYMSISEINIADLDFIKALTGDDFLYDLHGNRLMTTNKQAYYININSEHFRKLFVQFVGERIVNKSFNGVFLDTVDAIETFKDCDSGSNPKMESYKKLLADLKSTYPTLSIMQNRAFNTACTVGNQYLDALLWEEFAAYRGMNTQDWQWYQKNIRALHNLQESGVEIYAEAELVIDPTRNGNLHRILNYCNELEYHFTLSKSDNYMTWTY